jgi:hypothetical protein
MLALHVQFCCCPKLWWDGLELDKHAATESVPKQDPNLPKHIHGAMSVWLTPKHVEEYDVAWVREGR